MAIQYPIKWMSLQNITGVGSGKAAKFGKPFLELIQSTWRENDIDRPIDYGGWNQSSTNQGWKCIFIQNIDRKMLWMTWRFAKGMKMSELISEIESIVGSGTRIDINYYINEVIDEDRQKEVFGYFKTAKVILRKKRWMNWGENDYSAVWYPPDEN